MLAGIATAVALAALIGVCVLSRWLSEVTCRLERLETLNARPSSLSGQASLKLLRPTANHASVEYAHMSVEGLGRGQQETLLPDPPCKVIPLQSQSGWDSKGPSAGDRGYDGGSLSRGLALPFAPAPRISPRLPSDQRE